MSLLENDNMNNNTPKKEKKSILQLDHIFARKTDIFIIIALLIFLIIPVIVSLVPKPEIKAKQITLLLSSNSLDLFGSELTEILLQEFNENNPDIIIRYNEEDEAADILIFDDGGFNAYIDAGALADLTVYYYHKEEIDESENYQFDISAHEAVQFAIPLVSFMNMLFYNIDILTAVDFVNPPRTRSDFLSYARTVSRRNLPAADISGAAIGLNPEDRQSLSRDIFSWIWAAGGNFWSEGERPAFNVRSMTNDLTFFGTLNREGLFAPEIFLRTGSQQIEEFANGKIAMMIASTRVIPYLRKKMGDSAFGITTIPDAGTGGRYNISLSSIHTGISADSLHPEEAWRFIEFIAGKSALLCAELQAVPGSMFNLIPGDYVKDDPFYSKAWDIFEASQIVQGFSGKPDGQEYETIFFEELRIFLEGSRTAQQTVTVIQRRWNAVTSGE